MRRRAPRFAANLAIGLSALVAVCLLLEAGLAVAKINTRSNLMFDADTGVRFVPGAFYVHRKEGLSQGYFNSHGFRDVERTWKKAPDTYRIVVLGDSYVEALQVPLEQAFPARLEAKLNAASGARRFEVLALGQSGFGTADAYMRYRAFGVRYEPDMVVLAFLTGNDVRDNSKVLNLEKIGFYFTLDERGELVLDRSTLDDDRRNSTALRRVVRTVKRHSYLASLVSERTYLLREALREQRFKQAYASERAVSDLDEFSDLNVYLPERTPRWREAWRVTEKLLVTFAREVEATGAAFVLVTLSNPEQVHPQLQRELAAKYGLAFDFDLPDRRLSRVAETHGIRHLALMPAFRDYHRRTDIHLHGFGPVISGHWNSAGHRQAADEIFSFLKTGALSGQLS